MKLFAPVTAVFLLFAIGACAGGEAYVDRPYEYDRDSGDFPNGPTLVDGSEVKVCYAKSKATPAQILALAKEECGRFELTAELSRQRPFYCPLRTPVAAIFACSDGNPDNDDKPYGVRAVPAAQPFVTRAPSSMSGDGTGLTAADVSNTAKSAPFPTFLFNKGNAAQ